MNNTQLIRNPSNKSKKKKPSLKINTTIIHSESAKILKSLTINSTTKAKSRAKKFFITNRSTSKSSRITPKEKKDTSQDNFLKTPYLTSIKFQKTANYSNPFYKAEKSKTYRSHTVNSHMRENEVYFSTKKPKMKIENFDNSEVLEERNTHDAVRKLVKDHKTLERNTSMPFIRNISFIKNKLFLDDANVNKLTGNRKQRGDMSLEEIHNISNNIKETDIEENIPFPTDFNVISDVIEMRKYPKIENEIFHFFDDLPVDSKIYSKFEKGVLNGNILEEDLKKLKDKMIKYANSYGFKGCTDRDDNIKLVNWYQQMKIKNEENLGKFKDKNYKNFFDYLVNFKNTFTLFSQELIKIEEQKCKETGISIKNLYFENIEFFNILSKYFTLCLKEIERKYFIKIEDQKEKNKILREGLKFDNQQLKERIKNEENRNKDINMKLKKLRSKLTNDYTVKISIF